MLKQEERQEVTASGFVRYRWRLLTRGAGIPACLSYVIEGNRIRLPGRPGGVQFDFPIGDVVETEAVIVICLVVPEGRRCRDNVYAIDHEGNLLWRIRPQPFELRGTRYVALSAHGSFVRLHLNTGKTRDIDPRTGATIRPC